jgi:hypothetical protein
MFDSRRWSAQPHGLVPQGHRADGERRDDGVEGLDGDGDADHRRFSLAEPMA